MPLSPGMRPEWRIGYWLLYLVARVVFGLKIEGRQFVPRTGGLILAPNHLSNMDAPLVGIGVGVRELHFLAKAGLFRGTKFFAWLISHFNAIPLKEGKTSVEALRRIVGLLKNGNAVVIFPEGTRSKTGVMQEPQVGLGYVAAKTGVSVLPVYLKGTNARLLDLILRRSRFVVRFAQPIDPVTISGKANRKDLYRKISEEVMRSIVMLAER